MVLVPPLSFLSTAFLPLSLIPSWMRFIARVNAVNWAVEACRQSLESGTDWTVVLTRLGMLLIPALACVALSTRAFPSYRRAM